jgi:GAG-pre-integrase domain
MTINFSYQKTTITFPSSHPQLGSLLFNAKVICHLFLLQLDYIRTTIPFPSLALATFPIISNSFNLWHRHFGHSGQDAMRAMLTKNYATGITCNPILQTSLKCIPCLIGKTPQALFTHNMRLAANVCNLIHIDTCSPFPTLTPQKEAYFIAVLDDALNFGSIALLISKDGAYTAWQKIEASWTLESGNPICSAHLDRAKKFTQGAMSRHMISKCINVQITAPYTHQQNRKIKRYIRTIKDGIQTLIADSKLFLSFWEDAALTYVYFCNRLPTSTLEKEVTPYKSMNHSKPNLSHLQVMGVPMFPTNST